MAENESVRDRVVWGLTATAAEGLLNDWSAAGEIGQFQPAGPALTAIVASAQQLQKGDRLFGTARDWPAALVRGVSLETLLCQARGVDGDPSLGRGMPGAINDLAAGVALSDGNIASHLVHAAGYGQAARMRGESQVALAFFGAAAFGNGEVHAGFNFAAVTDAQVVFVARGPRGPRGTLAGKPLVEAAPAWGLHAVEVDGWDGQAIADAVAAARERAVAGGGPTLVDARCVGAARPADAAHLAEQGRWNADQAALVKGSIETSLRTARGAAEAAAAISVDTLQAHVVSGEQQ